MEIADALLPRLGFADIPQIHLKDYSQYDVGEYTNDSELLRRFLHQQGLTDAQISQKSSIEWSRWKSEYLEKGVPANTLLDRVPPLGDDAAWVETAHDLGITELDSFKEAWGRYSKHGFIDSMSQLVTDESGYTKAFSEFAKGYKSYTRAEGTLDRIYENLEQLESRAATSAEADKIVKWRSALERVEKYAVDRTAPDPTRFKYDPENPAEYAGQTPGWGEDLYDLDLDGPDVNDAWKSLEEQVAEQIKRESKELGVFEQEGPELGGTRSGRFEFDPSRQGGFVDQIMDYVPELGDTEGLRTYIEQEEARLRQKALLELPEDVQDDIRRANILNEEDLREMIWEKPEASNADLIRELQKIPPDLTVEQWVARQYSGASVERQYNHVLEIWDQERDLAQAMIELTEIEGGNKAVGELRDRLRGMRSEDSTGVDQFLRDEASDIVQSEHSPPMVLEEDPEFYGDLDLLSPIEEVRIPLDEFGRQGEEARIIGLSEESYNVNAELINEQINRAVAGDGWGNWLRTSAEGELILDLGSLAAQTGAGILLGQALHNGDQLALISAAVAGFEDVLGGVMGVTPLLGTEMVSWADRQKKAMVSTDANTDSLMFVRNGDEWVPALLGRQEEPTEFYSPLDVAGGVGHGKGAVNFSYRTGFGFVMKHGHLDFIKEGMSGHMLARKDDMSAGNQEMWKPWLNYYVPSQEEAKEYLKTGGFKPKKAASLDTIHQALGSSNEFKSLVELSHAMHAVQENMTLWTGNSFEKSMYFSGMRDERYKMGFQGDDVVASPLHPEMFQNLPDYVWGDASYSDILAWGLEIDNPDNWWQRVMAPNDFAHGESQRMFESVMRTLEKNWEDLPDRAQTELGHVDLGKVPQNAIQFTALLKDIQRDRTLSETTRKFLIDQQSARFWMRHSEVIDSGYDQSWKFTQSLGQPLLDKLQEAKSKFADLNPEAVIRGGRGQFGVGSTSFLLGEAEGQDTVLSHNAWGIEEPPKISAMPNIYTPSRAFVQAHNDSLPKSVTRNVPQTIPSR
jgi:hypothetical protein